IDRASQVLAQGLPLDVPRTYAALLEHAGGDVPPSQQYLTREEKKALIAFLLLISNLGHPV
ncbi:uncharacterized protein BDZ99DRAFT_428249, partial [Mytilinidion resinicola]